MDKRIVFKMPTGELGIITPTPEILEKYTIEQVANKDVPAGLAYKIINASELPEDRTFRDAWDIDESELVDGVGADSTEFEDAQ